MKPYFSDFVREPVLRSPLWTGCRSGGRFRRETVASVLNCKPEEIIFTSCGSESDNLAIRGAAYAMREKTGAKWILASRAEHPAVTKTLLHLEKYEGFLIEWLDVNEHGMVTPEIVSKAICNDTALVSVMYANNEIGTINPIKEIAEICRANQDPLPHRCCAGCGIFAC